MRIFAEVPGQGESNDSGVVQNGNFQLFRWLFFSDMGSRVTRTCRDRMLKFIRRVRNKLTGSSDVGFGGDGRRCRSLRR